VRQPAAGSDEVSRERSLLRGPRGEPCAKDSDRKELTASYCHDMGTGKTKLIEKGGGRFGSRFFKDGISEEKKGWFR